MHDCCFYRIIYISGNTKILEPNFQPNQHLFRSAFALNVTCTFSVFRARFHLSLSRLWFISIWDVDLFTKIIRLKFWIISGYFCININNLPCANQSVHQIDGYNGVIEIEKRNRFDEAFFFDKLCWCDGKGVEIGHIKCTHLRDVCIVIELVAKFQTIIIWRQCCWQWHSTQFKSIALDWK